MKYFFKGIALGVSLFAANKLLCLVFQNNYSRVSPIIIFLVFLAITTAFLVSKSLWQLFLCGFTGLFSMFFVEIIALPSLNEFTLWLLIYFFGFFGSMAAIIVSIVITVKSKKSEGFFRRNINMSNNANTNLKLKLLLYSVITAVSFSYLVMPEKASVSVPLFVLLQIVCLSFIVSDKKQFLLAIPILILSLNSFFSANTIWRVSNFIVCIILFVCMFAKPDFKSDNLGYLSDIAKRVTSPFALMEVPFKWTLELNSEKAPVLKRVAIALALSIPCIAILIVVLANADMVFSMKITHLFDSLFSNISLRSIFICICGIYMGLYLFGVVCYGCILKTQPKETKSFHFRGDLIIINILLTAVLFVYTMFVIIQFKYLFAGSALPDGLTYTTYARKGFFELLALTGINIASIYIVIKLIKNTISKWKTFSKFLCHYLCAVTVVLLASSFYRMWLYTNDDGLTRLRFFVMVFLAFEAIGLIITFVYIAKPKFNITLIYICIALTYYTVLNVIPTDYIISKNQINKYLSGERDGVHYIYTLSADASPALEYFYNETDNPDDKKQIIEFLTDRTSSDIPKRWQRFNLSVKNAENILESLKQK